MEYVGEVLGPLEFRSRVKRYNREGYQHHYFMALNTDEVIDATKKGNVSRFINHCCDPNCETQKVFYVFFDSLLDEGLVMLFTSFHCNTH
jgi:[histone H3]-lysine36 N-trimethyltransferase